MILDAYCTYPLWLFVGLVTAKDATVLAFAEAIFVRVVGPRVGKLGRQMMYSSWWTHPKSSCATIEVGVTSVGSLNSIDCDVRLEIDDAGIDVVEWEDLSVGGQKEQDSVIGAMTFGSTKSIDCGVDMKSTIQVWMWSNATIQG